MPRSTVHSHLQRRNRSYQVQNQKLKAFVSLTTLLLSMPVVTCWPSHARTVHSSEVSISRSIRH